MLRGAIFYTEFIKQERLWVYTTTVAEQFTTNINASGDQQWTTTPANYSTINVALLPPGNYTLEMYSNVIFDSCSSGVAAGTIIEDNAGAFYKATFIVTPNPAAQITVTATAGSTLFATYATLATAVTNINNAATHGGTVSCYVPAGYTETAPAGGYSISATGTAITPITFIKNGTGAKPIFTAPAYSSGFNINDAIFKIIGGDYITIDGFTMQERTFTPVAADIAPTTNTMTEFGVALLQGSVTNGCQNNTIQNCTITLNKAYLNTFGVYSSARHTATAMTMVLDATNTAGSNSNNKFYTNNISNVNVGIALLGSGISAAIDSGNNIGGATTGTGNTITNFGGGTVTSGYVTMTATNYGIFMYQQINDNISYNTITSAALTNAVTTGGVLKNYLSTGQPTGTITTNINNNTIQITNNPTSATTGEVICINNQGLTPLLNTATVNINNNTIQNSVLGGTTSTTNGLFCVTNSSLPETLNMTGNNILNNSITSNVATTGQFQGVSNSGGAGTINLNSNVIRGTVINTNTNYSGAFYGVLNSGAVATAVNINSNQVGNAFGNSVTYILASTNIIYGIYNQGGVTGCTLNINSNSIQGFSFVSATSIYGIINNNLFVGGNITISSNTLGSTAGNFVTFSAASTAGVNGIANSGGSATSALNISNNDISGITHAVAGSSFHRYIANSFATLSQTINSNTFTNLVVNTTGGVNFISNNVTATATGFKTINSNSIVTAFNKSAAGGTVRLYNDNGSSVAGCIVNNNNNNFSNITITGATTMEGWVNIDGINPTKTISNNTFTNWTCGSGAVVALLNGYNTTGGTFGNNINNITGSGAITGINTIGGGNGDHYDNIIHTLTGSGAAIVTGINVSAGATFNLYRNKIYNLEASNSGGSVNGILITNGVNTTVYNNTIGDLRTPAATAATAPVNQLVGINVLSGATNNIYHNTVLLNGSSTGANFGSSAIRVASGINLTLRNNILINNSTPKGAGLTVAYRRADTAFTNYQNASNNNIFYAGITGTNNLIYYDGTNSDQTLSSYQTRVGTARDTSSQTENVSFVSTSGANADFLRIAANTLTFAESGAPAITTPAISTDYWGVGRPFSPATLAYGTVAGTVDIGASEFDGRPLGIPCTTPTNQPTALTFSSITINSLSGSFTAATPSVPTSYIVIRSTVATLSVNPVDGTTYATGATLGGGIVITSTGTTFADSGLTVGTNYYYFVISVNSGSCIGGPKYLTTSLLNGSQPTRCSIATALALTANTTNPAGATISWTGAGNYIVEFGAVGFTPGTGTVAGAGGTIATSTGTTPYVLTGMTADSSQDVYVRQVCPLGGIYSANSTKLTFTPTCAGTPTGLTSSAITATGTTISWTASIPVPASGYEYFFSTSNTAPLVTQTPSGSVAAGILTANLSILTSGTIYFYWIRNNCDGTNKGTWSASGTFSTICTVASIPLFNGFNAPTIPNCWSTQLVPIGGTATIAQTATKISYLITAANPITNPNEGTHMVRYSSFLGSAGVAGAEERLVTPIMSSVAIASVDVEFDWRNNNNTVYSTGQYLNEGVQIQYSTDGGLTWINSGSLIPRHNGTLIAGTAVWSKQTVTLPAAAGNQSSLVVAFKFHSEWGDNMFIDSGHIKVTPEPIVITPSAPSICLGTPTPLTASSTNTGYVYTWSPATGLDATSGATVNANPLVNTTYTVTGVEAATTKTTTKTVLVTVLPVPMTPTVLPISANNCPATITTLVATSTNGTSGTAVIGTQSGTTNVAAITPFRLTVTTAARSQYLYTATELNLAGIIGAQNLTSVAFSVSDTSGFIQIAGYEIKIANTTSINTATNFSYTGSAFTNVYNGTNITPTTGLNTFVFATPFAWDGSSNILINICLTSSGTPGASLNVNAMASVLPVRTVGLNGSLAFTATTGGATNGVRPLITLGYNNIGYNPITWSPTVGLFTDAAATTAYTGSALNTVYAKPATTTTYIAATTLGTCPKSATTTITVNPTAVSGTISGGNLTVCSGNNNTLLSLSGNTGSIQWQSSLNNVSFIDISGQTGSTFTASNIVTTTYYRATSNGGCGNVFSNIVTINIISTTYDNLGNWSNGIPDGTMTIVFDKDFTMNSNLSGCSCIINSGKTLTINSGVALILKNQINSTGTTVFENNSSLIQTDGTVNINTGRITYKRNALVKKLDYVYWSTPVAGKDVNSIYAGTPVANTLSWLPTVPNSNGSQGDWTGTQGIMQAAKGYAIRVPNTLDPITATTITTTFVGVPNNGTYDYTISRGSRSGADVTAPNGATVTENDDNWNLIGNPYPSAIDINNFLELNKTQIQGSVDVWTHGTSPNGTNAQPFYDTFANNYSANDYITINGTAATVGPTGIDGTIAAGQGFFVKMNDGIGTANGIVTFTNAMRSATLNNNQFYRTSTNAMSNIEKNRIWLDMVCNSNNATTRLAIGYVTGATQGRDRLYDATTDYQGSQSFFSTIGPDIFSIQGRALPFLDSDTVSLGYAVPIAGSYKIAIHAVDGLFANNGQNIFLQDNATGIVHNLSQTPYTFITAMGGNKNRFVLRYTPGSLSYDNNVLNTNSVLVYKDKNTFKAISVSEPIKNITFYDILGRIVFTYDNINSTHFETINVLSQQQTLIVKITLTSGFIVTKKIIY